ncbi:MAG: site-specific integrase [Pseudomonadales bacterium]|nr:site-specific integrase [Pseudomonadales bacterium]
MKVTRQPCPLFDSFEGMANPFREPPQSLPHCLEAPPGALADYRLACEFLYSYRGSADTYSTYRREIEHFLQWCWLLADKNFQQIQREDIEAYVEFARNPPLAWIGRKNVARYLDKGGARLPNAEWRPYVCKPGSQPADYQMSQSALQSLFSVLGSFFNFLIQENHVESNPVAQIRQKGKFLRKRQESKQIRRLSAIQWDIIIETAEQMARTDPEVHERTLFIMSALYSMYLRISELVETDRWSPQMGHFYRDNEGNWWFQTVGKGNKERDISVSNDMLAALKRYRLSRGLSALPSPGELTALVHKTRGRGGISSTRQIRGIVQKCFDQAEARLNQEGFSEEAERLQAATVHWLRHTGISEDVKYRPREHVRDDAGHGSSAITDRYIDVERTERHASAKNKRVKP